MAVAARGAEAGVAKKGTLDHYAARRRIVRGALPRKEWELATWDSAAIVRLTRESTS
jgi:hypothetical protein